MQFASSGKLEDVQAFVATVIAQGGGRIIASSPSLTSAEYTKRFAWLTFILLMFLFGLGIIYLIWWFVARHQSLTVAYRQAEDVVYGTITTKGHKAKRAAKTIIKAFEVKA